MDLVKIYNLQVQKELLEKQLAEIEKEITTEKTIAEKELDLKGIKEYSELGFYINKFSKSTIQYKDEAEDIKLLSEQYNGRFIKNKLSQSIDKNALKKELKTNIELKEKLDTQLETKVTSYVVVTDSLAHKLMLENINKNKGQE